MKYYTVAEFEITDERWIPEYVQHVTKQVESRGGRFLARTSRVEKLEGERRAPQVCVVVEWPSREAAEAFYASEDYRPFLESRRAGARSAVFLVPGEDITGAARLS